MVVFATEEEDGLVVESHRRRVEGVETDLVHLERQHAHTDLVELALFPITVENELVVLVGNGLLLGVLVPNHVGPGLLDIGPEIDRCQPIVEEGHLVEDVVPHVVAVDLNAEHTVAAQHLFF